MSVSRHYKNFSVYNQWANLRLYDAVSEVSHVDYKADRGMFFQSFEGTLNHLLVTDHMCLTRITGEGFCPQRLDEVLHDDFDVLRNARAELDQKIINTIDALSDGEYGKKYTFMTVSNGEFSSVLNVMLAHFFNHHTHHRGQIHNCLSQVKIEPPVLDFLYFMREKGE